MQNIEVKWQEIEIKSEEENERVKVILDLSLCTNRFLSNTKIDLPARNKNTNCKFPEEREYDLSST